LALDLVQQAKKPETALKIKKRLNASVKRSISLS